MRTVSVLLILSIAFIASCGPAKSDGTSSNTASGSIAASTLNDEKAQAILTQYKSKLEGMDHNQLKAVENLDILIEEILKNNNIKLEDWNQFKKSHPDFESTYNKTKLEVVSKIETKTLGSIDTIDVPDLELDSLGEDIFKDVDLDQIDLGKQATKSPSENVPVSIKKPDILSGSHQKMPAGSAMDDLDLRDALDNSATKKDPKSNNPNSK